MNDNMKAVVYRKSFLNILYELKVVQIYELAAVMAFLMHFIFLGRRKGP